MLPKNLNFGQKVESSVARAYRSNISSANTIHALGDTAIFNIPTRNNLVLCPSESYLKFKVNVAAGAGVAARLDNCGAHGYIRRIRVWSGSNLLQDIDNYNLLASMLFSLQVSDGATRGKLGITTGTRTDEVDKDSTTVFKNTGALLGNLASSNVYCISLISLLGTLSSHYLPLYACSSAPIRLEITFESALRGAAAAVSVATTFDQMEYVAQYIELGDAAIGQIQSSLNGAPLSFPISDWRNYAYSQAVAASSEITFPIPAKFSSVRSLLIASRDKYQTDTYMPFSSVTNNIESAYFRIGSQVLPSKPMSGQAEFLMEALKAIGSVGDLTTTPTVDLISWTTVTTPAVTDTAAMVGGGSFCVAIDLESYPNSLSENLYAGTNTNTSDCYAVLKYGSSANTVASMRYDAFALFDEVIIFENGTAYVKF